MPFSQQHTELHFGKLFLVEKSRLTPMEEPRLMEMLLMATGKFFRVTKVVDDHGSEFSG